jgi:UDP-glucose:(glucosyl)LPS alpha-1,2-glucosyltransferase
MAVPHATPARIAIVLPPREAFARAGSGAISLMVHRLATRAAQFAPLVLGSETALVPYPDVPFHPVRPRRWPWGLNAAYAAGVMRVLRELRPALVEVHNQPEFALGIAARLPGARVALFLHNDPQGMRGGRTAPQRAALLARLAGIATVSHFLRARLLDGLPAPPSDKVAVLPNAIDLASLPPALPPEQRREKILFAGRVVADKGADTFAAACARALPGLPGWRGEMIGGDRFGPNSPDTPFLRDARRAAERAGIAFVGYRPHNEVLAAMACAAIVVVPSRWAEPFGLAALEAMACGAALICTRQGALPEVAGDAAFYVDPDDPVQLAEAITALATDAARRAALARAGLERARRFDLAPAAEALDAWRATILA